MRIAEYGLIGKLPKICEKQRIDVLKCLGYLINITSFCEFRGPINKCIPKKNVFHEVMITIILRLTNS